MSVSRLSHRSLGVLLLVIGSSVAHVYLLGRRYDYSGFLLPLDHLFTLFAASALFLLCVAAGRKVLVKAGTELNDPVEGIPFAAAIGAAGIGTVFLGAGVLALLRPWELAVIVAAILAFSWSEFPDVLHWLKRLPSSLRSHGLSNGAVGLQVLLLLFLLVLALKPPTDWDSLMYHLDVPADYLRQGRVYLPDDNLHAVLLGPIQLLYIPLLALGIPSAPAVFNVLSAAALPMAMLASASRFLTPGSGALASLGIWGTTTVVLVASTPRIDTTLCLFTFLGQSALLRAIQSRERRHYLLAAAILGAAVGVKLQAIAYILALLPMIAWAAIRQTSSDAHLRARALLKGTSAAIGMFALVGVLASSPWLARNLWMTGAPFYPVLASTQMPPWISGLFGTSQAPTTLDPYVYHWLGAVRAPFNPFDAFVAPHRLTIEEEGRFYFLSPLLLLTPLWLIHPRNTAANWLALGGITYLLTLLLPFPLTNLRYIIPAVAPLTLVTAHGLVLAFRRFTGARWIQGSLAAVALAPLALVAIIWGWGTPAVGHALGTRSERDYLTGFSGGVIATLRGVVQETPTTARVLFLFEARDYGVNREVLQDNNGTNWPWLVENGADDGCLAGTDISHVLVNNGAVEYYVSRGLDMSRLQWPAFHQFEDRCLEEIHRTADFWLFRVRR